MIFNLLSNCLLPSYLSSSTSTAATISLGIQAYECYSGMDTKQLQEYYNHCVQNFGYASQAVSKAVTFAYNNPVACAQVAAQTVKFSYNECESLSEFCDASNVVKTGITFVNSAVKASENRGYVTEQEIASAHEKSDAILKNSCSWSAFYAPQTSVAQHI